MTNAAVISPTKTVTTPRTSLTELAGDYTPIRIDSPLPPEHSHSATVQESPDSFWSRLCYCFCLKTRHDADAFMINTIAVIYFLAIAMNAIPKKLLINEVIAGDAEDPNSESAFVDSTSHFIHSAISFFGGRYTSGLGDYIGRKPVLIAAAVLFIISRLMYLTAKTSGDFYLAGFVAGAFECFYFSSMAWISDTFPEDSERSKRLGQFTGLVGGFGFFVGVPMGAVLSARVGPAFPFRLAILFALIVIVLLLVLPVDDTRGIKSGVGPEPLPSDPSSTSPPDPQSPIASVGGAPIERQTSKRALPEDLKAFVIHYFPISLGAYKQILKAEHPLDWLTNFLLHTTTGILNLILIQYSLSVLGFSAIETAALALAIGLGLGIFSPLFLHRYSPVPLATYTMCIFTLGVLIIAIAGTGISSASVLGLIGVIVCSCGTPFVPALQANILRQYSKEEQGEVSGMLGQQNTLSLLPAYIISLGFSLTVDSHPRNVMGDPVYFPGSSFAMVRMSLILAVSFFFFCVTILYCTHICICKLLASVML
jgi:MFS family permease